jgi:hypothetical protein
VEDEDKDDPDYDDAEDGDNEDLNFDDRAYDRIDQAELDEINEDRQRQGGEPNKDFAAAEDETEEDSLAAEAKSVDKTYKAGAPRRSGIINTSRPERYQAAQTKECTEIKECTGELKECSNVPIPGLIQDNSYLQMLQLEQCHNIMGDNDATIASREGFYSEEDTTVMASYIIEIHECANNHRVSFAQNYILQKGLKKFGDAGAAAASKELDQLHSPGTASCPAMS